MSVPTQTNRADLLKIWHECEGDKKLFAQTAELLGYQPSARYGVNDKPDLLLPETNPNDEVKPKPFQQESPLNPPEPRPQVTYYYLANRERYASEKEARDHEPAIFKGVSAITDEELTRFSSKHFEPLQPQVLTQSRTLTPFVRQRLRQAVGLRLDVKALVKKVARQQPLKELPTEPRMLPAGRVTVIADLNTRLLPFWEDMRQACDLIKQKHGKIGLDMRVLAKDEPLNDYYPYEEWLGQALHTKKWQKIPAQSMVFILSDLGQLAPKNSFIRQRWLYFIKQLNRRGITPIVLAPIPAEKQCPLFQARTQLILWQRFGRLSQQKSRGDEEQLQQLTERVLAFLSLSPHIEPVLLRALCELLALYEGQTGIEASVYLHPDVQWGYTAITLKAEARNQYQQRFKQEDETIKQAVLQCIQQHHNPQFASVFAETVLNAESLMALEPDVIQQAESIMLSFAKRFSTEQTHDGMQRFAKRHLNRLKSEQHQEKKYASALYGLAYREEINAGQAIPECYDTQIVNQVLREAQAQQSYTIRQVGEQLHIEASNDSSQGQVLAQFTTQQSSITINRQVMSLPITIALNEPLTIETGQERFIIHSLKKPSWASELKFTQGELSAILPFAGQSYALQPKVNPEQPDKLMWTTTQGAKEVGFDEYGLFGDVAIKGVTQRFRYIEPNTFMMGSPEDEEGRYDRYESYRQVTLTQGYWLADTACTQELWQVVMGDNPSEFKDSPQSPVENISWLDTQEFLAKLNQLIPNLKAHLPTEAQWENACRAGTITPFSFGENINLDLVNYDGNSPYTNGKKGEYREKTIPVKALPANPWGLYQMHGNVWEWCVDEWQENLGTEPVTDPANISLKSGVKPDKTGIQSSITLENTSVYDITMLANARDGVVLRMLRGGSWSGDGRYCRSALRYRDRAVDRRDYGFRIALGHEFQQSLVLHSNQDQYRDSDSAEKVENTSEQTGTNP